MIQNLALLELSWTSAKMCRSAGLVLPISRHHIWHVGYYWYSWKPILKPRALFYRTDWACSFKFLTQAWTKFWILDHCVAYRKPKAREVLCVTTTKLWKYSLTQNHSAVDYFGLKIPFSDLQIWLHLGVPFFAVGLF